MQASLPRFQPILPTAETKGHEALGQGRSPRRASPWSCSEGRSLLMSALACHLPSRQSSAVSVLSRLAQAHPRFYWQFHCLPSNLFLSVGIFLRVARARGGARAGLKTDGASASAPALGSVVAEDPWGIPFPGSKVGQKSRAENALGRAGPCQLSSPSTVLPGGMWEARSRSKNIGH